MEVGRDVAYRGLIFEIVISAKVFSLLKLTAVHDCFCAIREALKALMPHLTSHSELLSAQQLVEDMLDLRFFAKHVDVFIGSGCPLPLPSEDTILMSTKENLSSP